MKLLTYDLFPLPLPARQDEAVTVKRITQAQIDAREPRWWEKSDSTNGKLAKILEGKK